MHLRDGHLSLLERQQADGAQSEVIAPGRLLDHRPSETEELVLSNQRPLSEPSRQCDGH